MFLWLEMIEGLLKVKGRNTDLSFDGFFPFLLFYFVSFLCFFSFSFLLRDLRAGLWGLYAYQGNSQVLVSPDGEALRRLHTGGSKELQPSGFGELRRRWPLWSQQLVLIAGCLCLYHLLPAHTMARHVATRHVLSNVWTGVFTER